MDLPIVEKLQAELDREPFRPFSFELSDGRTIRVKTRDSAVLNSLAISVVEEAFSVTVIALEHIRGIFPSSA